VLKSVESPRPRVSIRCVAVTGKRQPNDCNGSRPTSRSAFKAAADMHNDRQPPKSSEKVCKRIGSECPLNLWMYTRCGGRVRLLHVTIERLGSTVIAGVGRRALLEGAGVRWLLSSCERRFKSGRSSPPSSGRSGSFRHETWRARARIPALRRCAGRTRSHPRHPSRCECAIRNQVPKPRPMNCRPCGCVWPRDRSSGEQGSFAQRVR